MRRRVWVLATLVVAVSVGMLAFAGPAAARKAPKEFVGLVPQNSLSNADLDRMARGKVGVVRFPLKWEAVEPIDDQFDFRVFDRLMGDLASRGIRPFPTVSGVPAYVDPDPLALPVDNAAQRAQWQEFLRAVVSRYGEGGTYWTSVYPAQHPGAPPLPVKTVQIWNEQNGPKHAHFPNPRLYGELVKISHAAISSQDPSMQVLLGGMFGTPTGEGGIKAWKFIKRLYGTPDVKGAFDGIALHPYSPDLKGIKKQIKKMRKALKQKKDKGKKLWLTEIGWGSKKGGTTSRLGVGKKKQAKLVKKSFKLLLKQRRKSKIGGVLYYTWRDLPRGESPCDWCTSAGLFNASGSKAKPAWKQYVKFTGGS
jgi:GH35 family endo-1,4-beta-xylanase